ncbi:UPF0696 protein C11orf68 homolog [Panulirus ornatus]|uniref:UPF0696 protein C11orf68 homolog n=1 Tax=Panulirus ornatus TaxID=150431 RepID=UPI003A89B886
MDKTSGNTKIKDAVTLHAEAQDMDDGEWIIYDVNCSETFSTWLEKYSPSKVYSDDGIGWIAVEGHTRRDHKKEHVALLDELLEAWDTLKESGRPIKLQTISDLAKTYFVTTGKWLFYVESGAKVDYLWRLVATGVVEGQLPSISAKVSPYKENTDGKHVICIYNNDFTNEEDVYLLESAIRKIGIKCKMYYKPDVFTLIGVYSRNEWGLRPSIYQSTFEITSRQSTISKSSQ